MLVLGVRATELGGPAIDLSVRPHPSKVSPAEDPVPGAWPGFLAVAQTHARSCGRRAAAHACRASGQPVLAGPGHLPEGQLIAAAGEKRAPGALSTRGAHILAGVVVELACPAGQLGELR